MEYQHHFKKKICLLGSLEDIKDEFQEKSSDSCLPFDNKLNIGVNISRADFLYKNDVKFDYFLWNIDCDREKAFLRTTFYPGAEAIIIFVSENNVDQIYYYFNEIKLRMPIITVAFCIVMNTHNIQEIIDAYFKTPEFNSLFQEHDFKFRYIKKPEKILRQISTSILKNMNLNEITDNFFVNFIPREKLTNDTTSLDESHGYFEPEVMIADEDKRINLKKLKDYLKKLDISTDKNHPEWIKIYNPDFGTFSVFLKNGNVYLNPKKCNECQKRRCKNANKSRHYVCIEAKTEGWSNINGLKKRELLILSKIFALKEATRKTLPESILNQIDKISLCN